MYVLRRQIAELFPMNEHVREDIVVEAVVSSGNVHAECSEKLL
jgi:hypothetical protein